MQVTFPISPSMTLIIGTLGSSICQQKISTFAIILSTPLAALLNCILPPFLPGEIRAFPSKWCARDRISHSIGRSVCHVSRLVGISAHRSVCMSDRLHIIFLSANWWNFLGVTKHLYNWLCPSVGWLVCRFVGLLGNAFVRRSTRRTLLAYLALFVTVLVLSSAPRAYVRPCWLRLIKWTS